MRKKAGSFGARRRRHGVAAATQYVIFLALGLTVLVALFFDCRLYYGIDVDGQPIYREVTRPEMLPGKPITADSAIGIDIEGAEG